MKKVLFSFVVMSLMAVGAQAQKSSCSKTCTAKPAAAAVNCSSESSTAAAAKLASMDASIESRTCPVSGTVSYVRKETGKNGAVSFVDVSYDASTNTFVNVSPVKAEAAKASCGTSATSASGKSCCATKASASKSCCAGKAKTASAATTAPADGKPVKTSGTN